MLEPTPEQSIRRLKTGSLLVAREVLKDANFDGTVLLLCAHREDGDYGLILNRSSYMPLTEIFESLPPHLRGPRRVCVGGPVEQEKVQILDWSGDPAPEAQQVVSGLFMGGHWDFSWKDDELPEGLRALGKSFVQTDPASYRIFIGYAGWEPDQLRSEIELGAWGVYDADIVAALELTPEKLPHGEKAFADWAARHPRKH